MLKMDNIDKSKEKLIESESAKILEDTNKKAHSTKQENNGKEYSVNNVMLEMLNKMINEVLVKDKSELRAINRKCTEITTKLSLQYNDRLEYCNRMLRKRVTSLDEINEECYRHISELNQEVSRLEIELFENERSIE